MRVRILLAAGTLLLCSGALWGAAAAHRRPHTPKAAPAVITSEAVQKADDMGNLLNGQWSYMPGASREAGGLRISPRGFAIVEQDGSGGQANPPVNLFGTHVEGASDFAITAQLQEVHGPASLQLYGRAPIIADEFRVERESLRLTLSNGTLTVQAWDGASQAAYATQTASYPAGTTFDIRVEHQNGKIQVLLNGQLAVQMLDYGIFKNGTVWIGADASDSSWLLANLQADGLNGKPLAIVDASSMHITTIDANGLQQLAHNIRPGFTIGAAMALAPLATDPQFAQVALGGNFGAMTTENALKWQFVEPQPGVYDFAEGDALVTLAARHGLAVQGHTLVFGEANPAWVHNLPVATPAEKQQVENVMLDHISTVMGHYKGKMTTWDVVNEPLADYDTFDSSSGQTYRNDIWYQAMGPAFITKAFTAARAADPHALLFMNEYGLEADGDRWDAFLGIVTTLKQQGVPIDGVGFEAHVYEAADKINPSVLQKHIRQLAAIGVKARVSEQDVYDEDGIGVQTEQYTSVLNACINEPNCISWTSWGVSNRYDYFLDDDGSVQQGNDFLWSASIQPIPAVGNVQKLLH